jgi:hypothetical protein
MKAVVKDVVIIKLRTLFLTGGSIGAVGRGPVKIPFFFGHSKLIGV